MKIPVKVVGFTALLVSLSLCVSGAQARNVVYYLSAKEAVETGKAQGVLSGEVNFYFGSQSYPAVEETLTKGVVAKKKSNMSERSDEEACNRAMLAALNQLQERANREGGNAVINIESYYKKRGFKSDEKVECHAGSFSSGVALKGDVVKLKN
jgi:uncharacterized protein YbjQ (UPF0145 family)